MRLGAAIVGDLRKMMATEAKRVGDAVDAAVRETTNALRDDWAGNINEAGLGKLSKSVRRKIYRNGNDPLSTAGYVYISGASARKAVEAFEFGAIVRPTGGRYLAIPTHFNRKGGRNGGKVLYRPDQIPGGFVRRTADGSLMLFAKVAKAQRKRNGVVRDLAFVNTQMLGSGRVRRTEEILKYGAVPMFLLVPQVRITKRLTLMAMRDRRLGELPGAILRHMEKLDHGD